MIRRMSKKRARIDRHMKKVYDEIDNEREHRCEGCWSRIKPLSHSHLIPRSRSQSLIAEKRNIRLHCDGGQDSCHKKWERHEIKKMHDTKANLEYIKEVDPEYHQIILSKMY